MRAKLLRRFVNSEAGGLGGYLEQNPPGLRKVDGVKVLAVENRRDVKPKALQLGLKRILGFLVFGPPRDVMNRSDGNRTSAETWCQTYVDHRPGS